MTTGLAGHLDDHDCAKRSVLVVVANLDSAKVGHAIVSAGASSSRRECNLKVLVDELASGAI